MTSMKRILDSKEAVKASLKLCFIAHQRIDTSVNLKSFTARLKFKFVLTESRVSGNLTNGILWLREFLCFGFSKVTENAFQNCNVGVSSNIYRANEIVYIFFV